VAQPLHLDVTYTSVVAKVGKVALQTVDNRSATTARSAFPQIYAMYTRLVTDCGINSKCIRILLSSFFEELHTILDKCVVFRIVTSSSSPVLQPWVCLGLLKQNVTSDLYPGHPSTNFYNPVSLRLPLPQASATYVTRAKRGTWNDFQWHAE